jgi:hypothetical protein
METKQTSGLTLQQAPVSHRLEVSFILSQVKGINRPNLPRITGGWALNPAKRGYKM